MGVNAIAPSPCHHCGTLVVFPAMKCEACGDRIIRPQPGPQLQFLSSEATIVLTGGSRGGGKELPLTEPVPTPTGWTTIGDLHVGDEIFDERGGVTRVLAVHEIDLRPDTYKIQFLDGAEILACADHRWLTFTHNERVSLTRRTPEFRARRRAGRPSRAKGTASARMTAVLAERNAKLGERNIKPPPTGRIRTTREILDTIDASHSIPYAGSMNMPEADLPVPPYLFGAWLGDGTKREGSISKPEQELFDHIAALGWESTPTTRMTRTVYGLKAALREMGVLGSRRVPMLYLRSSHEQRLELLRGLMDTDGYCDTRGRTEFCTTDPDLRDAFGQLVAGLGFHYSYSEGRATLQGRDKGPKYRFRVQATEQIFRLRRKAERFTPRQRRMRFIRTITPAAPVPMRCITVDNPTGLFVVGRSHIVTHNTHSLLMDWSRYISTPGANGMILRNELSQGQQGLWAFMEEFFDGTGAHSRMGQYMDFTWACRSESCPACVRRMWAKCTRSARLTLRHMGKNKREWERHKGPEYNWIGIEEADECDMGGIEFLLTCLRTSVPGLRPVMRLSCNPNGDHDLAQWVSYYLDDHGFPIKEKSGRVIYTMRSMKTGQRVFGETPVEVAAEADSTPDRAESFAFIASTYHDNLAIDHEQYGRKFANMDPEDRERYEDGCWLTGSSVDGMLAAKWWGPTLNEPLAKIKLQIRSWDFGASEPAKGRRPPDYTFSPLVKWDIHERWYVTEPVACRKEPDDVEAMFDARVLADGPHVIQALEVEPGAGGKVFAHSMRMRIRRLFCECKANGALPGQPGKPECHCVQPRIVLTSPKAGRQSGQSVKNTDPKIVKLKPVSRELRYGMRGNRPADRDPKEGEIWAPRGFLLVDPEDDWTRRPYRDKGDAPPTLGALWRSQVHRFPHAEKDDAPDSLGIAHAAKRMLETPPPAGRRKLTVVRA